MFPRKGRTSRTATSTDGSGGCAADRRAAPAARHDFPQSRAAPERMPSPKVCGKECLPKGGAPMRCEAAPERRQPIRTKRGPNEDETPMRCEAAPERRQPLRTKQGPNEDKTAMRCKAAPERSLQPRTRRVSNKDESPMRCEAAHELANGPIRGRGGSFAGAAAHRLPPDGGYRPSPPPPADALPAST